MNKAHKLVAALQGNKLIIMIPEQQFQTVFDVKDMIYAALVAEAINKLITYPENE